MEAVTTIDAMPASLKERVLTHMKYKCGGGVLKGVEQAALHLNCSRQAGWDGFADRLREYKTGKGAIQFPYDKPLPLALIPEIAKWCEKEYGAVFRLTYIPVV